MPTDHFSLNNLERLYQGAHCETISKKDRFVIFSDLHMGNGSRNDDFRINGDLFVTAMSQFYEPSHFGLILNGDVEELQRFSYPSIRRRWAPVYEILDRLKRQGRLLRLEGNHDTGIGFLLPDDEQVLEGLRLRYKDHELFLFHGHQTSRFFEHHNRKIEFFLRYLANPLHIKNTSVSHNSRKRFTTEKRAYEFATGKKVLAVIGHTHRPLFESMSKVDSIQFEIERLCRKYPKSKKQEKIAKRIDRLKTELMEVTLEENHRKKGASLYDEHLVVPSLFNSGCVLGKRGMTALELVDGVLRLVYWYDDTRPQKYLQYRDRKTIRIGDTPYHRVIIKEDNLDYIFSRIELLA